MVGPVPELVKVSLHQRVPLKLQQPTVEEHNKARPVVSEAKHDGYSVSMRSLCKAATGLERPRAFGVLERVTEPCTLYTPTRLHYVSTQLRLRGAKRTGIT